MQIALPLWSSTEGSLFSPSLSSSPFFSVLLNVCFKISMFDRCLNPYSRILHCFGNYLKLMTENPNFVPFSKCFLIPALPAFCQLVSFSTLITVLAKCCNFVHCTFGNRVNQHLAQEKLTQTEKRKEKQLKITCCVTSYVAVNGIILEKT